jgi:hypothetical protein
MIEVEKILPSDKRELMEEENYEIFNRDLMRKVFPRIIAEHDAQFGRKQRKPQIRDIVTLYFYLLSYVSGVHTLENGEPNPKFGAAFPAVKKIARETGIAEKRVKHLAGILEANGLLRQKQIWDGKLYFMSFCPRISDDGYVVNENGEKVVPDPSVYIRDSH